MCAGFDDSKGCGHFRILPKFDQSTGENQPKTTTNANTCNKVALLTDGLRLIGVVAVIRVKKRELHIVTK